MIGMIGKDVLCSWRAVPTNPPLHDTQPMPSNQDAPEQSPPPPELHYRRHGRARRTFTFSGSEELILLFVLVRLTLRFVFASVSLDHAFPLDSLAGFRSLLPFV
jgi:hypothetical protein